MKFDLFIYYYQASFVREKKEQWQLLGFFIFSVNSKPNLLRIHADRLKTDIWQLKFELILRSRIAANQVLSGRELDLCPCRLSSGKLAYQLVKCEVRIKS